MSKKFLADVIQQHSKMTKAAANMLAGALIEGMKTETIRSGRFTIPEFGSFAVKPTAKRTALNPRTGEKVQVKAGATVRFKASPALKKAAHAGMKKAKRASAKG